MKKILFIVDQPNWAWDIKSKNIKKFLFDNFKIDICYERGSFNNTLDIKRIRFHDYDALLVYGLYQNKYPSSLMSSNKLNFFQGISSCDEVRKDDDEKKFVNISNNVNAVFVHNNFLLDKFKKRMDHIFYCPNGVDIKKFYTMREIKKDTKELVVGFVGNSRSRGKKGLYDIIIPAIKTLKNVKIKYLDLAKNKTILHAEMPDFYNLIDCYICASESEGTPNPCLEAAACGRPLITTKVGNMPELVKDGENSLFFDRTIENFKKKIIFYRDNRDILIEHGKKIQKEVIKNWSWEKQAENYKRMFEEILKIQRKRNIISFDKIKNLENAKRSFLDKQININSYPLINYIESTRGCPFSCIMCCQESQSKKDISDMLLKKVEPHFKHLKILAIHGLGEPLISNKLDYFLDICKRNDICLHMNTNGFVLTKKLINKLLQVKLSIVISVHAGTASTYRKIMNYDLSKLKKKLIHLNNLNKKRGHKENILTLSYIVMNENIDEIEDFLYFAKSVGIKNVRFMKLSPNKRIMNGTSRGEFHFKYGDQFNDEIKQKFLSNYSFLKNKAKKLGIKVKTNIRLVNDSLMKECVVPWFGQLQVIQNGDVKLCCNSGYIIGNLFDNTFEEIWNSDKIKSIRTEFKKGIIPSVCKDCNGINMKTYLSFI